jgi:uncharacterized protein YndB with AHSA1/START domain
MASKRFELVTYWHLGAGVEQVWQHLCETDSWPSWWPSVTAVELLRRGRTPDGVGAIRRLHWKTALPYDLVFDVEVVGIEPLRRIEGRAFGELEGSGTWTLRPEAGGTIVRYDWKVDVTKAWMRTLSPVLRPIFAWNHGIVMRRGAAGLAGILQAATAGK